MIRRPAPRRRARRPSEVKLLIDLDVLRSDGLGALTLEARGLWLHAIAASVVDGTPGFVREARVFEARGAVAANELVRAGHWVRQADGFAMRDHAALWDVVAEETP